MTITLPNGATIDIIPSDSSARYAQLTGEDYLEIRFENPEHIEIAPGSSAVFNGTTYYVERPQDVKIVHRRKYEYTLTMYTAASRLKYLPFVNPDDGRVEFSVTGDASVHMALLVRAINSITGGQWSAGSVISGTEEAVITYSSLSLWESLELIAETFSTEFEIPGNTIHLRNVSYNKSLPLHLEYGKAKGLKSGITRNNLKNDPPVVAVAVKGGSRNLNTATNENAYGAKTLHMPLQVTHGIPNVIGFDGSKFAYSSYSQSGYSYDEEQGFNASAAKYYMISEDGRFLYYAGRNGLSPIMPSLTAGTKMDTIDLSKIYPTLTHTVSSVVAHQESSHGADGTVETYYVYDIGYDDGGIDYNEAMIPGTSSLTVIFQTGMLAGRELNANYYATPSPHIRILPKFIDDDRIPGGVFVPASGDTFRVFGCMLPQEYICNNTDHTGAEWDMAREAVVYMFGHGNLRYTWSNADLSGIFAAGMTQAQFEKIRIGGFVSFVDPEVQTEELLIRITEIKQPLNHPKWMEIRLEDYTLVRSRRRADNVAQSQAIAERINIEQTLSDQERDISRRPTIDKVSEIVEETVEEKNATSTNTTAYWNAHSTYIPRKGEVIIYSDGGSITQDGQTILVPKIKIGTGNDYLGQLPFVNQDDTNELDDHISDMVRHITAAERSLWNSKLNIDPNPASHFANETIIFNRN